MRTEKAGPHAPADPVAIVAKPRAPLVEEIDHVVIEREQGITPLTFGLEHDPLGACGSKDLADRRVQVSEKSPNPLLSSPLAVVGAALGSAVP